MNESSFGRIWTKKLRLGLYQDYAQFLKFGGDELVVTENHESQRMVVIV